MKGDTCVLGVKGLTSVSNCLLRTLNKLIIKHQAYPKSVKIAAIEVINI